MIPQKNTKKTKITFALFFVLLTDTQQPCLTNPILMRSPASTRASWRRPRLRRRTRSHLKKVRKSLFFLTVKKALQKALYDSSEREEVISSIILQDIELHICTEDLLRKKWVWAKAMMASNSSFSPAFAAIEQEKQATSWRPQAAILHCAHPLSHTLPSFCSLLLAV